MSEADDVLIPLEKAAITAMESNGGKDAYKIRDRFLASLNDTERNIVESLASKTMQGEELAKALNYAYTPHFRAIMSSLVKREILTNISSKGYKRVQGSPDSSPD